MGASDMATQRNPSVFKRGMGAVVCTAMAASSPAMAGESPDVIVVLIDTLRKDRTSVHHYDLDTTPFIAGVAAQGVVFDAAVSTGSHTAPTTASIFTSLFPLQHGITTGFFALQHHRFQTDKLTSTLTTLATIPPAITTLPEAFQAAGYKTFGVAGNVNICEELGFASGFDAFRLLDDADPKTATAPGASDLVDQLMAWDTELRGPDPVFVYLHFMDPHAPHSREAPWMETFAEKIPADGPQPTIDAAYASEIAHTDAQIQRAFEHFGWSRDAIVVFVSDHGEAFGDHGLRGHGRALYGELTDILFTIRAPGVAPQRIDDPVGSIDLLPTVASLAGLPASDGWQGLDLSPLLRGTEDAKVWSQTLMERPLYGTVRRSLADGKPGHSVTMGTMKLVGSPTHWELYDRSLDPAELHNVAHSRPQDVRVLASLIDRYAQTLPTDPSAEVTIELSADEIEQLKVLGYVE